MTVSTIENRKSYTGDGVSTVFSFPYKFISATDLDVYVAGTLKTLTTDYSVGTPTDSGANVTFVTPPASGASVVFVRDPDALQQTDLPSNGKFPADSVELALDKLTLLAQRFKDLISRSFTLGDGDASIVDTTLPTPEAYKLIGWNSDNTKLQNYNPADIATSIVGSNYLVTNATGDGTTVAYVLPSDPLTANNTEVFVGGVFQPSSNYTLAGATLTFTTAPPSGASVVIRQAIAVTYPVTSLSAGSINTAAYADLSIITAKLADQSVATAKVADKAVTLAKIQDASATKRVIGRKSSGSGVFEEITASDVLNFISSSSGSLLYCTPSGWVALASGFSGQILKFFSGFPIWDSVQNTGVGVQSASGNLNLSSSIPPWATRISVVFSGLSTNGTSPIVVQISNISGYLTSGYASSSSSSQGTVNTSSSGFSITHSTGIAAAGIYHGKMELNKVGNDWVCSGVASRTDAANMFLFAGKITEASITSIRIGMQNGTDTFDAGTVIFYYE